MVKPRVICEAAEDYCQRGLFVIPAHHPLFNDDGSVTCSCGQFHDAGKKGKHPAVGWAKYQNQCPQLRQVIRWFGGIFAGYNIACVHGAASGTVLLDFDGLEGFASQRELEQELGELPATPTVMSGGGGSHMIFKHPGVHVPTNKGLRTAFDVRGDGGISILPPSTHEFGEYIWECDLEMNDTPIAGLPTSWVQFITQPVTGNRSTVMPPVQWQKAADGTILVTDGRELYMRDVVWSKLMELMQNGHLPTADELFVAAAEVYMPSIDTTKPGRGLDELLIKCRAAVAKVNRPKPKRGLSRPFLAISQ